MKDQDKTKRQLIRELAELRQRIAAWKVPEDAHKRVEAVLPEKGMWLSVAITFVPLCLFVWLDEILDLPYILLRAPLTPVNWREVVMEVFLIGGVGLFAVARLICSGTKRVQAEATGMRKRIWLPVVIMFILLCFFVWMNEILDLPHLLLRAPRTPINWREAMMEMFLIAGVGVFAVTRLICNITEWMRAEKALWESEQRCRMIYDTVNALIIAHDMDFNVVHMNPYACRVLGYEEGEMIGKDIRSMLETSECERAEPIREQVTTDSNVQVEGFEQWYLKKGGGRLLISWNVTALRDASGNAVSILGAGQDITQRKKAEGQLRESAIVRAEAERLAATGRMAARIAHEINNPLAGIKNSFILVKDAVPRDHPDYDLVGRIEKEIDRIARIVRQMYKLYSTDEEPPRDICIAETIREVVLMLQPSWREHDVRVDVKTPDPALSARISEGSLRQVLYNLVENAIEASSQGGGVKITAIKAEESIRISISDQGGGVSSEIQERVFEPFFSTKQGPRTCGMGLGLSIVREIVGALKGTIEFQSTRGQGSVFEVVLPI